MRSALMICLCFVPSAFPQTASQGPLTDDRIIELTRSGVRPAELVAIIGSAPQVAFDLTPAAEQQMMDAGISEDTIKAMAARQNNTQFTRAERPASVSTVSAPALSVDAPTRPTHAPQPSVQAAPPTQAPNENDRHKLTYDGGSIANLKTGAGVKLYLEPNWIRIRKDHSDLIVVPASAVTEISYGQDVHRRVGTAIGLLPVSFGASALMALAKSKKHYIGMTWDIGGNKGGAAFQADKRDYRGVLTGLEGITGIRAINSGAMTVKN